MGVLIRTLTDPVTYRRLVYLLLGLPLGIAWFVALVTTWSLVLGLLVTPMVIPLLFAIAYMTRGFATIEAEIARGLLGVPAQPPAPRALVAGFWARLGSLFDGDFWRAQVFLWLRWFIGFPVAVAMIGLLGGAVGMIVAPLWLPFVPGGAHFGIWRAHGLLESLALVPLGVILLPLTVAAAAPLGALCGPIATGLLRGSGDRGERPFEQAQPAGPARAVASRRPVNGHAAADSVIAGFVIVIWAATSRGYFWPIWVMLPLGAALAIHAWLVELRLRPALLRRFRGSHSLAATAGVASIVWLFTFVVWAITGHGYFWPLWTAIGVGAVVAAHAAAVLVGSPGSAEMAERIERLQSTRAGAVNVQESELRRIERDLHDGAQARLVALGMSLGMAEQKLADDPERAGELLAEARAGAEHALRELRDLARGIHPPVLADRGLEAALEALANSTPMHVALSVDVSPRPASSVESAAYFVVAEALANAGKHAHADWVEIRIARVGHRLEVEVRDDGAGGANPEGSGLMGLRRRVEALDGTLEVTSPPGGPTTLYAELPCA